MPGWPILVVLLCGQVPDQPIDGSMFAALLERAQADVRTIELLCEGTGIFVADVPEAPAKQKEYNVTTQSLYAYRRSDSATYLDLYKSLQQAPQNRARQTTALLDGVKTQLGNTADQLRPSQPRTDNAKLGSARIEGSPERFLFQFFWDHFLKYRDRIGFRFDRWEMIDGHRCAVVEIDRSGLPPGQSKSHDLYWVDLERGGNTLKQEFSVNGKLWLRVDQIQLKRVPTQDGKTVWLPVRGQYTSFVYGDGTLAQPVFTEEYYVVTGSLVINSPQPDGNFAIKRENALAAKQPNSPRIAAPPQVTKRIDARGVEEDQKARLAEADRKSPMLDARPATGPFGPTSSVLMFGFGLGACAFLIAAIVIQRRS